MVQSVVVISATVATVGACLVGYGIYFDYCRRHAPEFRRDLRRQERRVKRAVKHASEAAAQREADEIKDLAMEARNITFPSEPTERQNYIMLVLEQAQRELDRGVDTNKTAFFFLKALLASPAKMALIAAYEQQLPKSVLQVLSRMVVLIPNISDELFLSDMSNNGPD